MKDGVYLSAGPPGRTHVITTGRDLFLSSCAPPSKEKEYSLKNATFIIAIIKFTYKMLAEKLNYLLLMLEENM